MGAGGRVELGDPPPGLDAESLAGWEIGRLLVLLADGATEVQGADPVRVRRVRAVLDALEAAREPAP